jgi:hypothetical protein
MHKEIKLLHMWIEGQSAFADVINKVTLFAVALLWLLKIVLNPKHILHLHNKYCDALYCKNGIADVSL